MEHNTYLTNIIINYINKSPLFLLLFYHLFLAIQFKLSSQVYIDKYFIKLGSHFFKFNYSLNL